MSKLSDLRPTIGSILLVEDDDEIRGSLRDVLEAYIPGIEVHAAPDGEEALRLLAKQAVDVIVSDFKMPGMDGLAFLAAARDLSPDTPRILLTAYPELNVAKKAIEDAAISNFLTKPIRPETLIEAINASLVKARMNPYADAFGAEDEVSLGALRG